mgnify:CR=1 FL=1
MKYRHLIVEHSDSVATLTLNRPESLNALNERLRYELCIAIGAIAADDDIRVVVVNGTGRSFCSGDDIKLDSDEDTLIGEKKGPDDVMIAFRNLPKPIISQVHGHCLGAGLELALASDICIATEDAEFGCPFVRRAIAWGGTLLPKFIGMRRATEMMLRGDPINAATALEWGIVNKVVASEFLDSETAQWIDHFSAAATIAIGYVKQNLTRGWHLSVEDGYTLVTRNRTQNRMSHDASEGGSAFREKRDAIFVGR